MEHSGKVIHWLRAAVGFAVTWCSVQSANANVCFQKPSGVPGLPDEPVWFAAAGKVQRPDLNEPRWGAAPLMDFESSSLGASGYRLVSNVVGDELTISIQALASTWTSPTAIYFGIAASSTQAVAVNLALPASGTNPITVSSGQNWTYDGTWSPFLGVPAWVKSPAAWRNPGAGVQWAINFKVLLSDVGVSKTTAFQTFLGISTGGMIQFSTPDSSGSTVISGSIIPQSLSEWTTATAVDQGCPGGVRLAWNQIGSDFVDASSTAMPWRVNTAVGAANSFHATPDYSAVGGPILNAFKADFRIADWGSVADPNASWPFINTTKVNNDASGNFSVSCAAATAANVCGVTGAHIAVPDHCVQVSISNDNGSTTPISQASAFRNMLFGTASEFRRNARLSLEAKPEFKRTPKDLYLLVQTNNMDAPGEVKRASDVQALDRLRKELEFRAPNPKDSPAPDKPQDNPAPEPADVKAAKPAKATSAAVAKAKLAAVAAPAVRYPVVDAFQQLADVWPTYQVFAYFDSGDTVELDGVVRPRLHAMFPFGAFIRHEGVHYGFRHELETEMGVTLEELSPNFYHVKFPAGKTEFALGVHITAEEKPLSHSIPGVTPGGGCPACVEDAIKRHEVRHCHCRLIGAGQSASGTASVALLAGLVGLSLARRRRHKAERSN